MNATHSPRTHRTGFTLIELLVVIAIIAVLAAMGFGAGAVAINNARKLTARADATGLVGAVEGYFDDYNHLPEVSVTGGNVDTDVDVKSDQNLMNILLAFGTGKEKNPKEIRFYQGKQAKGNSIDAAYGGVYYSGQNADLFDAWKKKNGIRRYQVLMDSDYDEELIDPFATGKIFYGVRVIAWSTGKDGEETRGKESDEKNRDNVYTWK